MEYKTIEGFDGKYAVNSIGEVKNLKTGKILAKEYNVSISAIRDIKSLRTWKHVSKGGI